ncbi:MAG: diguanylate cyclase (GGDEF)-like protein [Gammaproteobacteria bacterium]|jgi:diguanylate cyclase (GGDEF)-like protein
MPQLINFADGAERLSEAVAIEPRFPDKASKDEKYLRALQLGNLLSRSQDVVNILRTFFNEIEAEIKFNGYRYVSEEAEANYSEGETRGYSVNYRLKVESLVLGELIIFLPDPPAGDQISQIEDLLCALVYPLKNALMYQVALKSAFRDPLTGLNNRSSMEKFLPREIDLCKRHHQDMALLVVDLDAFKAINDQFGHDVGDQVLSSVAEVMISVVRNTDLLYRYGGDEFVCGLVQTGTSGAMDVAERIRYGVEGLSIHEGKKLVPVEVSIGITMMRPDDQLKNSFKRADKALYRAKNSGKNQTFFA